MKRQDEELDRILDEAVGQIRESGPDPRLQREAADRVWQRLQAEPGLLEAEEADGRIRSCSDFQALIDAYLRKELSPAKALLAKDHFGECVPCRRALKERRAAKARIVAGTPAASPRSWGSKLGWRIAAAAVIFVAVYGLSFKTDVLSFESGGIVRVETLEGELFKITDDGSVPLAEGDTVDLEKGENIRAAKGANALLRLPDDSQVEMRERSELAVLTRNYLVPGRRDDGVIDLGRGSIIVEASDQGSGHLYVDTNHCNVAVTGTVFAVNTGIKGSRVSVIEGEVEVNHGTNQDVLAPGDQTTTLGLGTVPVEQEIAWSQNHERYVTLLREMRAISREIEQVMRPELRYSTDLLELAPADTVVYAAMPNVSDGIGEAWEIIQTRVAANSMLDSWWQEQFGAEETAEIDRVFDKIRAYGDSLGKEILLTVPWDDGDASEPLFLARTTNAAAFVSMLREDIAEMREEVDHGPWLTVIEGKLPVEPEGSHDMFFWVDDDLLAVSPSFDSLRTLDSIKRGQYVSLAGSTFSDRLAKRYGQGVEWLVGVDLETMLQGELSSDPTLADLGFSEVQHLIAERRSAGERTENRADITFSGPRRSMAAWLAEPAPLGSLDYVSPDASFAVGFAMKDLGTLVDELFDVIGANEENFWDELGRFESEAGIDVRRDIAAPLGGEFTFAIDGPILPKPSWKLVMEVYDPAKLQEAIAWIVERVNEEHVGEGFQGVELDREDAGGRTYLRILSLDTGLEAHIAFNEGYMIAAPSRALIDRAIQTRATGITLADSPAFRELLPRDDQVNFSGVFYSHLGPVIGPLSGTIQSLASELGTEQQALMKAITEESAPTLALVYGLEDQISVVGSADGGLLTSGLNSLSGFGGLLGMQQSLIRSMADEAAAHGEHEVRVDIREDIRGQ